MSPKKKKKSSKPKAKPKTLRSKKEDVNAVGKKLSNEVKEKPRRRLIPFTAGRLPSVSKAMPAAANVMPSVSKELPSVSKPVPLVSAVPNITLPRQWGILPSRKWGASKVRATRRREPMRPKDVGLFKFLGKVLTAPCQAVDMVKGVASEIHSQAEEEREPEVALEQELLELKMSLEMNEISEEEYRTQEARIKKRSKELEEREEVEEKTEEIKETPEMRKKPGRKKKSKK